MSAPVLTTRHVWKPAHSFAGGVWELIYTDTQPFRSSPFFMAVDELFGDERGLAEALFAFHRAATSNGEIGRVKQTISESLIVSCTLREAC